MVEGSFLKGDDDGLVELYVNHRGHTHYITLHCIAFQSIGDTINSWP